MTGYRSSPSSGHCAKRPIAGRTIALALFAVLTMLPGCSGSRRSGAHDDPARDDAALLRELHRSSRDQPTQAYWPQRLAEFHYAHGAADSATVHAERALAIDPDYAPALALRSRLYDERGEHAAAIAMLRAADVRRPLDAALLAGLALHLDRIEAFEEADAVYDQLAPAQPGTDGALLYRQLSGEQFAQSEPLASAAVERDPRDAAKRNNLGVALLYAGKPDEAREQLLQAHELDAQLPGPLYNLAILDRYYRFDDAGARSWLDRYLALSSEDPDGLIELFARGDAAADGEEARR